MWKAPSSTDSPPPYRSALDGSESDGPPISASGCSHDGNDPRPSTACAIIIVLMIIAFIIGGFVVPNMADWRRQREDSEARQRAQIHWLALESSKHCERYGTRKYWAKMGPLVGGYDPMKACWTSEMEIHGRKMKPTYCEDKGADRGVYGHWIVDFDEGGCRPFWEGFKDKGCTAPGSGLRRFDAHLINFDYADGWNVMCSSTPADFNGLHFNGAMSCVKRIFGGVFGTWDVVDRDCL